MEGLLPFDEEEEAPAPPPPPPFFFRARFWEAASWNAATVSGFSAAKASAAAWIFGFVGWEKKKVSFFFFGREKINEKTQKKTNKE